MNLLATLYIVLAAACLGAVTSASAAEFKRTTDGRCLIEISGPIHRGDFDRFLPIAKAAFPEFNGESTAPNLVCLNSPGGDVADAVRFARHFYKKGVGTVIREDDACYSACAILFMLGTAQGPEVAFVNRTLYVGGIIGFHRPSLMVPEGDQVDSGKLRIAYDLAVSRMLDLISIANNKSPWTGDPMIKADLMQAMLAHVGNNFFYIDTIDDVGRFDIGLQGISEYAALTEESAFYACNNALQWQHGLHDEDIAYTNFVAKLPTDYRPVTSFVTASGTEAFEIRAVRDGYANHGCIVTQSDGQLLACGVDEYHSVQLGGGICDRSNFAEKLAPITPIAAWNPATKLTLLSSAKNNPPGYRGLRCYVVNQSRIIDDEPCKVETSHYVDGFSTFVYTWPSGSRTVVAQSSQGLLLNGGTTRLISRDGWPTCYPNLQTGNEFCVRPDG